MEVGIPFKTAGTTAVRYYKHCQTKQKQTGGSCALIINVVEVPGFTHLSSSA